MPFTKENENGNSQSGICGDNLTWMLDGGTLTIRGGGRMYNYVYTRGYWTANVSPAEIESEYHPTPWDCQKDTITKAAIENGVTSIGEGAFWCCGNLASVTIPNSVTSVEDLVFHDCASLLSIAIANGVTRIGWDAFSKCTSLKDVYYSGTEEDRGKIKMDYGNSELMDAVWHYKK